MLRTSDLFRDQVTTMTTWFNQWTECEQTVALYSLIRQLSVLQARFVEHLLQEQASSDTELDHAEHAANSLDFVSRLAAESPQTEGILERLLLYFPLLYPGNDSVKAEYLKIIPRVLVHAIESGSSDEPCRQLLTYALIHPAVTVSERTQFTALLDKLQEQFTRKIAQSQMSQCNLRRLSTYLQHLDDAISLVGSAGQKTTGSAQQGSQAYPCNGSWLASTPSKASSQVNFDDDMVGDADAGLLMESRHHNPLHATASAPCGSLTSSVPREPGGQSVLPGARHTPLSRTVSGAAPRTSKSVTWTGQASPVTSWLQSQQSGGHSGGFGSRQRELVSPRSSLSSTSDTSDRQDDDDDSSVAAAATADLQPPSAAAASCGSTATLRCTYTEEGSGMRDFPAWLKALRLHKYSSLFATVTYDDMLRVDEKWLETRGVTKGARHKLAASIAKLRERPAMLRSIEQEVLRGSNLRHWLTELRSIIATPMKPFNSVPSAPAAGNAAAAVQLLSASSSPPPDPAKQQLASESIENGVLLVVPGDDRSASPQHATAEPSAGSPSGESSAGASALSSTEQDDIAGLFARVMARMCTQLLVSSAGSVDDECFPLYTHLVDKCVHHEAFARQRKLLYSWKQQVQQKLVVRSPSCTLVTSGGNPYGLRSGPAGGVAAVPSSHSFTDLRSSGVRSKHWSSQQCLQQTGIPMQQQQQQHRRGPLNLAGLPGGSTRSGLFGHPSSAMQRVYQQSQPWSAAVGSPAGGYPAPKKPLSLTYSGPDALAGFTNKHTLDVPSAMVKPAIHRTHSAPLHVVIGAQQQQMMTFAALSRRPNADGGSGDSALDLARRAGSAVVTEPEINARLDSLCLSMTKAALDPDYSSSESSKPVA